MQQHTTNPTIDTLETLYWQARDSGRDALAKAIGLALDAAIEVKADEDRPLRNLLPLDSETPTDHDDDEYTNADLYGPVTELPSTSQPTAEVSKSTPTSASFSRWTQKCAECNRVFDMDVDIDANEWQYGHDCETPTNHTDTTANVEECDGWLITGPRWDAHRNEPLLCWKCGRSVQH